MERTWWRRQPLWRDARVLMLTNVDVPDAALYSVVVSNAYGVVTSAVARLEVIFSPPYLSPGPEDQTVLAGSSVTFSVEAGGDALVFPVARERDQPGGWRQYLRLEHGRP